ncbi:MAG: hypothetical protein ISS94_04705 [Candidatus Syntrophoarchaeum sp.]|nr:hypothetical protein [Candidatus Syntrophoarchaeum sp.]
MSVLLIAETNWLENLVLVQDSTSAYLMRLARTEKIDIAVPEYSFYEADGSLNRKLIKRAERIDEALSLLGQISQTEHYAELCEIGRDSLKELKRLTLSDKAEMKKVHEPGIKESFIHRPGPSEDAIAIMSVNGLTKKLAIVGVGLHPKLNIDCLVGRNLFGEIDVHFICHYNNHNIGGE